MRVVPADVDYPLERRNPGVDVAHMTFDNSDNAEGANEVRVRVQRCLGVPPRAFEVAMQILGD